MRCTGFRAGIAQGRYKAILTRASHTLAAIRSLAAPMAVTAFWVGMAGAAHLYSPSYDWRYQTISVLLYADKDPRGYLWAWAGMQLAGLAGVLWTLDLSRPLRSVAGRQHTVSARLLQAGFFCMACAVIPQRLLPWPKGHQIFAILSFLSICSGTARQMFIAAHRQTPRRPNGGSRARVIIYTALPLITPALAAATQAYLTFVRPDLPWVSPKWRALGVSPFLSFGLWEWVTSAAYSVCLLVIWNSRRKMNSGHEPAPSLH